MQLLAGDGNPPTWEEANTLYATLQHMVQEDAGTDVRENDDIDLEELRLIVESTDLLPPYRREAARHFATKILRWGQENSTRYIEIYLNEMEHNSKKNGYFRLDKNIKKSREELNNHLWQRSKVIEGTVAIAHTSPEPPAYYQDVFDGELLLELTGFQEQKIMRLDGHQIRVEVDYLETGIRITYVVCNSYYVKGFVAIEVLSSGVVAVYFRWIPAQDDERERLIRSVAWGLAGSIRLCIHTHGAFGARGNMNSCLLLPEYNLDESRNFNLEKLKIDEYGKVFNATIAHFGDIFERIIGDKGVEDYLHESKYTLWSEPL
ncbi:hypothetical protein [Glutamicibacter soli]